METSSLHRGRLIDHLQLVVRDLAASRRFYEAVLGVLGVPIGSTSEDYFWADELFVSTRHSQAAQGALTGRHHWHSRRMTGRWGSVPPGGIAGGGKDNGPPGDRPYHPGYYAAFLLDPDGNNVEAVFHGVAKRSAASVLIDFHS